MKTKNMFSKVFALLLALVMVFAMGTTVFAEDSVKEVATGQGGSATITIKNAANGVKYEVYKIFDATVTGTKDGSIAYQVMSGKENDDLPTGFKLDKAKNVVNDSDSQIIQDEGTKYSKEQLSSLISYGTKVKEYTASGEKILKFTGLTYGYYLVISSQGASVTVTSTNPDAEIIDKNTTEPIVTPSKTVGAETDADKVYVGQTVTYTVSVVTANYDGDEQIKKYYIKDTLPEFLDLEENAVTSITITAPDKTVTTLNPTPQFVKNADGTGEITIDWVDSNNTSKYKNESTLTITYTAKVNSKVAYGSSGNTNKVYITYETDEKKPYKNTEDASETIYTYAFAIQKTDENNKNLAGAKFKIAGYALEGSAGRYTVTGTSTTGTEVECDTNGLVIIFGVPGTEAITVTETEAPKGYLKLEDPFTINTFNTATVTTTTTTKTIYYDADDNIVDEQVEGGKSETQTIITPDKVNNIPAQPLKNGKGELLPSTGGIGTTIFYVVGGVLVAGATIALVVRKRMSNYQD